MRYNCRLTVMLDKNSYDEVHALMNYSLESEEGMCMFKLYEGDQKQGWYRLLMREGLRAMRQKFEREKHRLQKLPEE